MRVAVVGGGVIGLSCAWQLALGGAEVTLWDPDPGRGASRIAAGMLAPLTEAHPTETELLAAGRDALALWPEFAAALTDPGYLTTGTLVTAHDADDLAVLEEFAARLDVEVERLSGSACRTLEPALAPGVRGGLNIPGDQSVDNRALLRSLWAACADVGVTVQARQVQALDDLVADVVVVATGTWAGQLVPALGDLVRPVRGQNVRLTAGRFTPRLARTVRSVVAGYAVYLVPRENGELVIGATQDEVGFDPTVTAGGVYRLLADARAVVPSVDEYTLVETSAGLRPVSRDGAPLVGWTDARRVLAVGHGRNGFLFAPLTAHLVARAIFNGEPPYAPFDPARFGTAVAR